MTSPKPRSSIHRVHAACFAAGKGLDPVIVPSIVERAHRDNLRVFAHVESAAPPRRGWPPNATSS